MFGSWVLEKAVCYYHCILLTELCEPLSCLILYCKAKLACYSRYLLTFYFCIPVPYDEKDILLLLLLLLILEDLVSLHRTGQLLRHQWSGHKLGLL